MNAFSAARLDDCTSPLEDCIVTEASGLWEPGTVIGYRYRIGRVLDIGGMATVYEATQLDLVRRVAIKVPKNDGSSDASGASRFEREARTLAALQHPHIVSVFELGRSEEGVSFMAMELVEGPALHAHIAAAGPLPWRTAASVALQLAEALQCAHASGVVHGDVSARNVLMLRRGEMLDSKLIDFGAARKAGERPQLAWGTRRYVAPELFAGEAPHVRSDLYALGALIKEMLGDALGSSPGSLRALVDSMLSVEPPGRPESAGEVALRLHELLEVQPAPSSGMTTIHADPADVSRHRSLVAPPAGHSRRRWVVAGVTSSVMLCALVANGYRGSPGPLNSSVVAAPVVMQVEEPVASLEVARRVPPPQPVPQPPPQSSATLVSTEVAPAAVPAVSAVVAGLSADESGERGDIVALLDQWLDARNLTGSSEYPSQKATRVGEPGIVFDPRGTSASVTYRALLMYSNGSGGTHAIVEEQAFFAKESDSWQLVDPDF